MAKADLIPSFNLVRLERLCILNLLWVSKCKMFHVIIIQHIVTLPNMVMVQ